MKKAVILFSGGMDSTTCLAYALSLGYSCHALSFSYGQRHTTELKAAETIAAYFKVTHQIFHLDIGQFGGSALTDDNIPVPDYVTTTQIPTTYVPARNTIFLSIGLALAETVKAEAIFIGVSHVDYSNYPDCRPEYIDAFQQLANLATKSGVEGGGVTIYTPLIHLSKSETIQMGHQLGIDYAMTVSCYVADAEGRACGQCASCMLRKKGFSEANIEDSTRYVNV